MDIIYYQSCSFLEVLSMVAQKDCYIFCEKAILSLYLHTCRLVTLVAQFLEMIFHGAERGRELGV